MKEKQPIDPEYVRGMTDQLYRALLFLVGLCLVVVLSVVGYVAWGDDVAAWRRPASTAAPDEAASTPVAAADEAPEIVDGIHVPTGLVAAAGFEEVRAACTACHSAQLVIQNRNTREGWESLIRWMQETQGLWDLGPKEGVILDYLAAYYAPQEAGRRANLDVEAIEWYILE